jgi:serine protease DegQ
MGLATNTRGILLSGVLEGGPADRAGAKPGDILISINGQAIRDVRELLSKVAELKPGTEATFTGLRKNKEFQLRVQIGKRPKPKTNN